MITNVLKCKDSTKITYLLIGKDRFSDNDKFKGYTPVDSWINNITCFDKISKDLIGKPIEATYELKQRYDNPLSNYAVLKSLDNNGIIIDLL